MHLTLTPLPLRQPSPFPVCCTKPRRQGALLNEVPGGDDPTKYSFAGSTIVVQAASREEIKEILRKDVYAKSGVWDVENVSFPYLTPCSNS